MATTDYIYHALGVIHYLLLMIDSGNARSTTTWPENKRSGPARVEGLPGGRWFLPSPSPAFSGPPRWAGAFSS